MYCQWAVTILVLLLVDGQGIGEQLVKSGKAHSSNHKAYVIIPAAGIF